MADSLSPEQFASSLEQLANVDIETLSKHPDFTEYRRKAFAAVRRLQHSLETPYELSRRIGWQEPSVVAALQIALDLGLLAQLQKQSPHDVTTQHLAEQASQPEDLIDRVLRHLTAWGIVKQTSRNSYCATNTSNAFLDPKVNSGLTFWLNISSKSLSNLPTYIREGRYNDRVTPGKGIWEAASGGNLPFFAWLKENPETMAAFAAHVEAFKEGRATWLDLYPADDRLIKEAEPEGPLIVDVGSGVGQIVQLFYDKFPQPAGRLIVQDLEHVLQQSKIDPAITRQPHDFFTEQPVVGARAYLLQYVLHDWVDEECLKILSHIAKAMKKGYSKLLVSEYVVASQNPDPMNTALDITVLSGLGAKERTEDAWRELFEQAGLKIEKFWSVPGNQESVIELVLA